MLLALVPELIGAGLNYAQRAQQKKFMAEAEDAAAKALLAARGRLEQAPLEELQVPVEAYQTAMREFTSQQMQATQALAEAGSRELLGGVGRVGALGTNYLEGQREAMSQDLYRRDTAIAQDEARRLSMLANLDLQEASGAQQAAGAAQQAMYELSASAAGGITRGLTKSYEQMNLNPLIPPDAIANQENQENFNRFQENYRLMKQLEEQRGQTKVDFSSLQRPGAVFTPEQWDQTKVDFSSLQRPGAVFTPLNSWPG